MTRTHDTLYLNEDRYRKPTELTKFSVALALSEWNDFSPGQAANSVCDVGCAAGEFLYYLGERAPKMWLTGVDVRDDLLNRATDRVPRANFVRESVLSDGFAEKVGGPFDLVFMKGVTPIFDDPLPAISNCVAIAGNSSSGGRGALCVVVGLFNEFEVDVFVRYRGPGQSEEHRESGWNIYSMARVERHLASLPRVVRFKWVKFEMPLPIEPQEDPLRTWTVRMGDGTLAVTNALRILMPNWALVIQTAPTDYGPE